MSDKNREGKLRPAEVKRMLKEIIDGIERRGSAKVESDGFPL